MTTLDISEFSRSMGQFGRSLENLVRPAESFSRKSGGCSGGCGCGGGCGGSCGCSGGVAARNRGPSTYENGWGAVTGVRGEVQLHRVVETGRLRVPKGIVADAVNPETNVNAAGPRRFAGAGTVSNGPESAHQGGGVYIIEGGGGRDSGKQSRDVAIALQWACPCYTYDTVPAGKGVSRIVATPTLPAYTGMSSEESRALGHKEFCKCYCKHIAGCTLIELFFGLESPVVIQAYSEDRYREDRNKVPGSPKWSYRTKSGPWDENQMKSQSDHGQDGGDGAHKVHIIEWRSSYVSEDSARGAGPGGVRVRCAARRQTRSLLTRRHMRSSGRLGNSPLIMMRTTQPSRIRPFVS